MPKVPKTTPQCHPHVPFDVRKPNRDSRGLRQRIRPRVCPYPPSTVHILHMIIEKLPDLSRDAIEPGKLIVKTLEQIALGCGCKY